jgi:hypothetical protein
VVVKVAISGCKAVCRRPDTGEVEVTDYRYVTYVHDTDQDWVIPDESTSTCR